MCLRPISIYLINIEDVEAWLVVSTYYYMKNIKPGVYLKLSGSQIPIFPTKI